MTERSKKHLYDVQSALAAIAAYTQGMQETEYLENDLVQAAVERKLEIIGEALNRIGREDEELLHQIQDHQRIIGLRNILAHGYDIVDQRIIWDVIHNHLSALNKTVDRLLLR